MNLIALTGYAGTGKDTVRAILEQHGYKGLALADPLRNMIEALLGYAGADFNYMEQRELKEAAIPQLGVSYRHLAQTLGTEWGRGSIRPDLWLHLTGLRLDAIQRGTFIHRFNGVVISDVRFVNEAEWVRKRGGVIWRIEREGVERVRAHVSESQIYAFAADRVIPNHGTPEALNDAVMSALYGTEAAA